MPKVAEDFTNLTNNFNFASVVKAMGDKEVYVVVTYDESATAFKAWKEENRNQDSTFYTLPNNKGIPGFEKDVIVCETRASARAVHAADFSVKEIPVLKLSPVKLSPA